MKAIIFDLQGTLMENGLFPSPLKQARHILRINIPFHDFVLKFEKYFMTSKFDSLSDAFRDVSEKFSLKTPDFVIEKLVGMWNKNKLLSKTYSDTIDILEALKGKYKLILIANIDSSTKDIVLKDDIISYFDYSFFSCDVGLLKSDKAFFETVLDKTGLDKEDILLVGDSIESDMNSAKVFGIKHVLLDRNDTREFEPKLKSLAELELFLKEK